MKFRILITWFRKHGQGAQCNFSDLAANILVGPPGILGYEVLYRQPTGTCLVALAESLSCTRMHFAQIIFPYDRIYPGGFAPQLSRLELITLLEQYAYMCDLKRTLDATVRFKLL